jgi:hypothetical protein
MRSAALAVLWVELGILAASRQDLVVLQSHQLIYDRVAELRIATENLMGPEYQIRLNFSSELTEDKDYALSKHGKGSHQTLILKLLPGRR